MRAQCTFEGVYQSGSPVNQSPNEKGQKSNKLRIVVVRVNFGMNGGKIIGQWEKNKKNKKENQRKETKANNNKSKQKQKTR